MALVKYSPNAARGFVPVFVGQYKPSSFLQQGLCDIILTLFSSILPNPQVATYPQSYPNLGKGREPFNGLLGGWGPKFKTKRIIDSCTEWVTSPHVHMSSAPLWSGSSGINTWKLVISRLLNQVKSPSMNFLCRILITLL